MAHKNGRNANPAALCLSKRIRYNFNININETTYRNSIFYKDSVSHHSSSWKYPWYKSDNDKLNDERRSKCGNSASARLFISSEMREIRIASDAS